MNSLETQKIQNEFNNNFQKIIKKQEAEKKLLIKLIIIAFSISLIFIFLCTIVSIRNYEKMKTQNELDNYVIKVKVEEYEV